MEIFPRRLERLKEVARQRQYDLTVILENVHDPHNIGAVLRTCDSVGVNEIYILNTDERLANKNVTVGHKSASGSRQWIDIRYFESVEECMSEVKNQYNHIYGTAIGHDSSSLYDLNLSSSCALLFGNEHEGISQQALSYVDMNFLIPQHGFVQSLNISVACAVSLYEACRQREMEGAYNKSFGLIPQHIVTYDKYVEIHKQKKYNKINNRPI
jgi:tRNA (guanosine-2'-O-)-methyltransferase